MPLDGDTAGRFGRVPTELRTRRQWVCWKYGPAPSGKPTKLPIQPRNGQLADVTNPDDWDTFEAAAAALASELWGAHGIGFVFGPDDPYAGIDLDSLAEKPHLRKVHDRVYAAFESYAERSPSGQGLHIIVRGSVPDGLRSEAFAMEIYSSARFFTMTGDVYRAAPIADCHDMLTALHGELRALTGRHSDHDAGAVLLNATPATQDDDAVWAAALASSRGEKLRRLANGDPSDIPPGRDQTGSGIDLALVNVIQQFTKNPEQIERLWRKTRHAQGRPTKMARAPYVMRTIGLAFDREVPPVDFTALQAKWEAQRASEAAPTEAGEETPMAPQADLAPRQPCRTAAASNPYDLPPGLMGRIANFIYDAAPRQVHEIALAAAIGWLAGHAGRAYNIKGTGLNVYLAMVASSGAGKEAISSGYNRLLKATSSIAYQATSGTQPLATLKAQPPPSR